MKVYLVFLASVLIVISVLIFAVVFAPIVVKTQEGKGSNIYDYRNKSFKVHSRMKQIYNDHKISSKTKGQNNLFAEIVRSYPAKEILIGGTEDSVRFRAEFKQVILPEGEIIEKALLHFRTETEFSKEFQVEINNVSCTVKSDTETADIEITQLVEKWTTEADIKQAVIIEFVSKEHTRLLKSIAEKLANTFDPVILVFTSESKKTRKRRQLELEVYEEESNKISDYSPGLFSKYFTTKGRNEKRRHSRYYRGHCKKRPLYIDFKKINYDSWIIAPKGYEAYECSGKCTFPVADHLTPTKHTVLQALMHGSQPDRVARPCCVPTKLEPISLLYVDEYETVTFKYNYEDMVVSACGCR
ncbi:hypothetical protein QYM36_006608 [Artemia franciscana]|uniref:TGF-beta family profile domain-containing protein n=2 Tax=Artemia franciscana TaxID=6661 RepID=A0AA88HXW7_ARTSF|nr:hypothetical protein QYM36_006608 [Artemia franciscana]